MFLDIAQRVAVEYVIIPVLLSIVTAAIGWASLKWQQWTGQQIEEKKKRDLHQAAENAIRLAIQNILNGSAPTTESQRQAILKVAPQYVAKTVPGALQHFNIDPKGATLQDILATKLPIFGLDTEKKP